jgi:hypothetical protein
VLIFSVNLDEKDLTNVELMKEKEVSFFLTQMNVTSL